MVAPNFLLGEKSTNNPMQSPVMAAVHSIITKRTTMQQTTKLQTIRPYGRLFNSLFKGRTITLLTFIQWHQASALQFFTLITNCGYSTVLLDSLCCRRLFPEPVTCINQKSKKLKNIYFKKLKINRNLSRKFFISITKPLTTRKNLNKVLTIFYFPLPSILTQV